MNSGIDVAFIMNFEAITGWHPTTMIDRLPIKIQVIQLDKGKKSRRIRKATNVSITEIQLSVASVCISVHENQRDDCNKKNMATSFANAFYTAV